MRNGYIFFTSSSDKIIPQAAKKISLLKDWNVISIVQYIFLNYYPTSSPAPDCHQECHLCHHPAQPGLENGRWYVILVKKSTTPRLGICHKSHKWHLCKIFLGWGQFFTRFGKWPYIDHLNSNEFQFKFWQTYLQHWINMGEAILHRGTISRMMKFSFWNVDVKSILYHISSSMHASARTF